MERGVGEVSPGVEVIWLDHWSRVYVKLQQSTLQLFTVPQRHCKGIAFELKVPLH